MNKWFRIVGSLTAGVLMAGCVSGPKPGVMVNPYRPILKRTITPVLETKRGIPEKRDGREALASVSAATNQMPDSILDRGERVLRKGDRIQVTIYAPPEPFTCPHVVDEDGRINLPLIGAMGVAGKSCGAAQRFIEKTYIEQQIYRTVTVIIVPPEGEYTVSGEVIRPGTYPLGRDQALTQAVSKAGRLTEYGDSHRVFLTRNNERVEVNMDEIRQGKRKDIVIISGDVIEVPRSPW